MSKNQKILLLFIGFCMILVLALIAFNVLMPKPDVKADDIEVSQRSTEEELLNDKNKAADEEEKAKEYVNIYFIGKNEHHEEVYKAVKREYNKEVDGSKIRFALYSLVSGPRVIEKQKGVYTEIPNSAQIINIKESPDRIVVNMNSAYVDTGGTDSLYKRLYQLIKTAKLNTDLPVYLYIDGQRAEVVGGEGIMISQPLSNSSLDN